MPQIFELFSISGKVIASAYSYTSPNPLLKIDVCIISRSCVTYKRGSVKDERLKLSRGDKEIDSKLSERHSVAIKYKSVGGVNGFGSLSYQISPKKIVMLDEVENDWLLDM